LSGITHAQLYNCAHAQDARKSEDIHNFTCTEWTEGEGVGVTRTVNYEVTKNLGLTTANIKVAQKHVRIKLLENSETVFEKLVF
jgi:hypothetical protein